MANKTLKMYQYVNNVRGLLYNGLVKLLRCVHVAGRFTIVQESVRNLTGNCIRRHVSNRWMLVKLSAGLKKTCSFDEYPRVKCVDKVEIRTISYMSRMTHSHFVNISIYYIFLSSKSVWYLIHLWCHVGQNVIKHDSQVAK